MKTCPSCSAEVPFEASRCKHCFHDFSEAQVKKSNPMVALLALHFARQARRGAWRVPLAPRPMEATT